MSIDKRAISLIIVLVLVIILNTVVPHNMKIPLALVLFVLLIFYFIYRKLTVKPEEIEKKKIEAAKKYKKEIEKNKHPLYFLSPKIYNLLRYFMIVTFLVFFLMGVGAHINILENNDYTKNIFKVSVALFFATPWIFGLYCWWIARSREKIFPYALVLSLLLIVVSLFLTRIIGMEGLVSMGIFLLGLLGIVLVPYVFGILMLCQYVSPGQFYQKYKNKIKKSLV